MDIPTFKGNSSAQLTLVDFSDLQCHYKDIMHINAINYKKIINMAKLDTNHAFYTGNIPKC